MAQTQPEATYADYLAAAATSEVKLEFAGGEILARSPGTLDAVYDGVVPPA